jgi:hypothetical protein
VTGDFAGDPFRVRAPTLDSFSLRRRLIDEHQCSQQGRYVGGSASRAGTTTVDSGWSAPPIREGAPTLFSVNEEHACTSAINRVAGRSTVGGGGVAKAAPRPSVAACSALVS